ncbi:MAG TPA: hypothetical protein VIX37_00390 [Candidatus Sulfotelmatobacter sp.]
MTESEVVAAGAIGEEAQVADAMEAVRQGVQLPRDNQGERRG